MRLDDVRGFVFDVDGTLVRRFPDGVHPLPGAVEVLERIRSSGRPLVLFTNGSHVPPGVLGAQLRKDGLPIGDDELVTPVRSALSYLRRRRYSVSLFAEPAVRELLREAGVRLDDERPDAVLVLHTNTIDFGSLERAARAILAGAKFLTANYLPAYAGANGPIFSRGAMVTAAIAKASGARPTVVGKPSRAAVQELRDRLGVPSEAWLVTGDDVRMDIGLGRLGGSRTVLVRTGITGDAALADNRRPDHVVDSVAELLDYIR
jgi:HAD superfamily hydrolase (TIGR01450 family)